MSRKKPTRRTATKAEKIFAEVESITADMRLEIGDWEPPTNERWVDLTNPICPSLRMAWVTIMHKTSAEIADMVKTMKDGEPDALAFLMRQLNWTGGYLEKLQELCHAAEVRLHVHGAPKAVQDWLQDSPLPPEPKQDWRAPPKLKAVK